MSNEKTKIPEVEVVDSGGKKAPPRNEPLPEEDEILDDAMKMIEEDGDEDQGPMIDEGLLEYTCHQLFDLYQKTGNHEVRRLAKLVGQGLSAILGADPREFFPDAPPIRDPNGPQYAPTYPGEARPGWPAAHEAHGSGGGSFAPTQPVVDRNGQPIGGGGAAGPVGNPPGFMAGNVPVQRMHQSNPSGAEMRVVNDPTGTMQSDGDMGPQFVQGANPSMIGQPARGPRRRRRG